MSNFVPSVRKVPFDDYPEMAVLTLGIRSYLVTGLAHTFTTDAHILVGNYCSLAHELDFYLGMNHNHHAISCYPFASVLNASDENQHAAYNHHQIIIGHDVWIGASVSLISGIHIGNGAVIGAGTVVAKDVPPYAIAIGNPMRIIKYRFDKKTIARLQRIKWWNWPQEKIEKYIPAYGDDMAGFLDKFDVPETGEDLDKTAASIMNLRAEGYEVSYLIPDFEIQFPYAIWTRVIDSFLTAYTTQDRAALVLAIPDGADAYAQAIAARIAEVGARAPLILTHTCSRSLPFSIAALQAASAYITTREPICSHAVDYAADAGVAIRYGLDRGALLFPRLT